MKKPRWAALASAGFVTFVIGFTALHAFAAPSGWLNVDGNLRFAGGGGTVDWANSGVPGAACANGGINISGSGGIFNCGRASVVAGAPPLAPTLTAAASADPTIISAVFIVDPIAGDSAGCGGNDPTILSGAGPKNGDAIGSYVVSSGTVPAKTELSNVYAVSHTKADGHPELYFGAERLVNNGDSHMDFEFLQSSIRRTAACGGGFTGHRTEGDLLVAVDFTNGGTLAGFSVWQWHCAAEPGPQPADGTVCDPTGVPHYEQNLTPTFADLTVNAAMIPCGGWICRDQVTGNSTQVAANDFLEGGVDLEGTPFMGCFSTFLPHTRTAQSFTSVLKDIAGPVDFSSCRRPATTSTSSPSGAGVTAGSAATDTVTVTNGGAGLNPVGTITFFLCGPAQVTTGGCVSGGAQVGAVKTIVAGSATSDPTAPIQFNGKYCWRTVYTPDASLAGVYQSSTHTNSTSECFTVSGGINLPDTGLPDLPSPRAIAPFGGLLVVPLFVLGLVWRRSRSVSAILIAGLVAGSSPATPPRVSQPSQVAQAAIPRVTAPAVAPSPPVFDTERARAAGWRLVIPRLGIDALIQPVGLDRGGAMAAPASIDTVGWFSGGPVPGAPGDAVIDGHYGVSQPAVFRQLRFLRPGDEIEVVWPGGRTVTFEVSTKATVPAASHPTDLFSHSGPARLALITCSGAWIDTQATYSDRLIVTAMLA